MLANCPIIPDELLAYRDREEVVFFCGAGVSMPAGLRSFFRLTTQVMARLGVPATSQAGIAMADAIRENDPTLAPPLDQVYLAYLILVQRQNHQAFRGVAHGSTTTAGNELTDVNPPCRKRQEHALLTGATALSHSPRKFRK